MRNHTTYMEQLAGRVTFGTGRGIILGYQEPDDLNWNGFWNGLREISSVIYDATIGRLFKAGRGKPSKLDTDMEGWRHMDSPASLGRRE